MSIFDKASTALLASGAAGKGGDGNGTFYSIKPTNGDGDFNLNRGANIGATRVAKDGTIEKGRENLALHSNTFDNAVWGTQGSGTTLTSGSAGYDGTSDAWQLTVSGESGNVNQSLTTTGVKTISVYAKSVSGSGIRLYGNESGGSNHVSVYFALTGDGSVLGTPSNSITQTITKVGNDGWYRCSITLDKTLTKFYFYVTDGASSNSTDGTVLIQDAQAEVGLVATGYINSGSSTGKSGLIVDEPRFDYTGGGCPKLLLEPSRVNRVKASEYFDHLHWGDTSLAELPITNSLISPEGVKNAAKIVAGTPNTAHAVYTHEIAVTSGTKYTISCFAKQSPNKNRLTVTFTKSDFSDFGFDEPVFNLDDGTITGDSSNAKMIKYEDGWWRCIVTSSPNASENGRVRLLVLQPDGTQDYSGTSDDFLYLYGAQFEDNPAASSYIPTHGTSATRDADVVTNLAIPEVNNDEYTFFVHDVNGLEENGNRGPRLSDQTSGSGNDALMGYYVQNGQKNFFCYTDTGSGVKAFPNHSSSVVDAKYAFTVDNVNLRVRGFVNGELIGDGTPAVTTEPTHITMASSDGDPNELHQIIYFPTVLSNTEVKILTGATSYVSFGAMTDALTNYTTYE